MFHLNTVLFFALWQSTLLLGLALLLGQFFQTTPRKTPWQAHDLYWYGIIAAVVTPIFSSVVDVYDGGWLGGGPSVESITIPLSLWESRISEIQWVRGAGPALDFATIFGATFLLGMASFALLLIYGIISSRKLMFLAKPFPDRESQEALLRGSEMLQNLSLPILFTSPSVKSPTVWCWGLHPAVVLPDELTSKLADEERDAIFLHELAHIARRDHLTAFFARICGLFLFWNPLYWLCLRQVDLLADEACDLMVLSKGNITAETLAETLLRLAAGERHTPARYLSTLQFLSRKERMMKRINTILDFGEGRNTLLSVRPSRLWQCSAFLFMLALSGTLAFCQTQDKPKPIVAEKAKMMGYVEDFFMNNYRDITMRKSLEWGDVQTDDKGNGTIRYKFEALIWDKDRKIMCQDFTFDKDGNYVDTKNLDGFPQDVEKPDTSTTEGMKKLVEKFFSQNYRDITKRKTLEWGEPETSLPNPGSVHRRIRYKYEATIWGKDVITQDKTFTFTKDGEFVSVNDTGSTLGAMPTPEVEAADKFMDAFLKEDYDKAISFYDEKMKKALSVEMLKQIRADLTTKFGDMTDFRAVKTESLLGYIRVHEQGNFKLGSAVFMVVVNKEQKISGFFLGSTEKAETESAKSKTGTDDLTTTLKDHFSLELRKEIQKSDIIKWYPVKKRIADFPADGIDLSTPENSYATQKNLIVSNRKDKVGQLENMTVGRGKMSERERKSLENPEAEDTAKIYRENFIVFEVFVLNDKEAFVFGLRTFDGLYDGNFFRKEGDEWLNMGNDQSFDATEIAERVEQRFGRAIKIAQVLKEGLEEKSTPALTGKVKFSDGTPVSSGNIIFAPAWIKGLSFSGVKLNEDGTFTMDYIVPGEYSVFFADNDEIDAKYHTAETSDLRITVDSNTKVFDVMVERAVWKTPEGGYTHLVVFGPNGDFRPETPMDYLNLVNPKLTQFGIRCGYFRSKPVDGVLIAYNATSTPEEYKTLVELIPQLKYIETIRLTKEMFEEYEKTPQLSLDSTRLSEIEKIGFKNSMTCKKPTCAGTKTCSVPIML